MGGNADDAWLARPSVVGVMSSKHNGSRLPLILW
jgi:hypothetical protein